MHFILNQLQNYCFYLIYANNYAKKRINNTLF